MADFPNSVKLFPTLTDGVDSILANHQNERGDEITAIEDYLLNTLILPDGWATGYRIVPSISSNSLVIDIVKPNGDAPSVENPLIFRIRTVLLSISSNPSFLIPSGTNYMNLGSTNLIGGNSVDLFLYAIAETGAAAGLKFGLSRIPYARIMSDFVNTNTDERYIAGNYTNWNNGDYVRVVGRIRAAMSAGTFLWSIPSSNVVNVPILETDWLYYSPALTGIVSQDATQIWRYQIRNRDATVFGRQNANTTSNLASFTCPLPISCRDDLSQTMAWSGAGLMVEGAANYIGVVRILSTSPTSMTFFKDATATNNWATTGNKRIAQISPMLFEI